MAPPTRDQHPDDDARVADALRELRVGYIAATPDRSLEERVLARAAATSQRHRSAFVPGRWSSRWPAGGRVGVGAIVAVAGLAAVLAIASVGSGIFAAHPKPSSSPLGSAAAPSAGATDAPAVNAPHEAGTCPVTPITRIAGGAAPEVDVSGLRWRWGGRPWVAHEPQKVVWLADAGGGPSVSVFATQLDRPIVLAGQTLNFTIIYDSALGYPFNPSHPVYPLASDVFVGGLVVPGPGCWLLTAVWANGASSVVVAVAPPASPPSPGPSNMPSLGGPLSACPATQPSITPPPQGWRGLAYDDGPFQWLLPPAAAWRIGGSGDKLVLGPGIDWAAREGEVVALPVALAANLGRPYGSSVTGDLPTVGSGTLGMGLTLPTLDCWAIVYLDTAGTSTVVANLAQVASLGSGQAMAELQVGLNVEPVPEPSGIDCTCPDFSTYVARLTSAGGKEVATWNLRDPGGFDDRLDPGSYSLVVSRVLVTDNVDTGARTSSAPIAQCSTDLTLEPGTTTSLRATFSLAASTCRLGVPQVTAP